ncbi:hypothetical protein J5U22_00536 [Saccharolobus shibatae]|uniref:Uncharacterized protein n=1 Tax=Saccharolobus shibatae TaxID=2286 RepID=A0A8F5GYD9_9CREN|nr:hypothetical protein J5U21_00605 [Saccharolobus shibatae]QXJ33991.1 hypothetical protein J5U22_00536 [Saccharolobus shibatae]
MFLDDINIYNYKAYLINIIARNIIFIYSIAYYSTRIMKE